MHNMDDDTRREVLGEVLMDELKAIREYLQDIPVIKQKLTNVGSDVAELKSDMKVVKAAATDQSKVLDDHERRISRFEAA